PEFVRAEIHTRWLDEWLKTRPAAGSGPHAADEESEQAAEDAALAGALAFHLDRQAAPAGTNGVGNESGVSRWKQEGRRGLVGGFPER
ncbi:MAG: hypothetical protein ACRD5L_07330, partial [Bryobacteraceae bacterium]